MKTLFLAFGMLVILTSFGQKSVSSNPAPPTKPRTTTVIKESTVNPNAKPFTFTGSFTLNYTVVDTAKKSTTGTVKYAFDGFQVSVSPTFTNLIEIKSMRSIFDIKVSEMTMLTEYSKGKKSALLLKTPKTIINTNKTTEQPLSIKKTSDKKLIQGYNCEKIVIIYENGRKIESWVTTDLLLNMEETLGLCNLGFKGKSPFSTTSLIDIKGTALETTVSEKNGTSIKISLTEISKTKPNATIFTTDGYDVKDARGIPMFGGK